MESKDIELFLNSIRDAKAEHTSQLSEVTYCDQYTQDLLHKLELDKSLKYHDKGQISNKLTEIRIRRRAAKDRVEVLTPIIKFINDNKKTLDMMGFLLGEVRKIEKRQQTRSYTPRISESDSIKG